MLEIVLLPQLCLLARQITSAIFSPRLTDYTSTGASRTEVTEESISRLVSLPKFAAQPALSKHRGAVRGETDVKTEPDRSPPCELLYALAPDTISMI